MFWYIPQAKKKIIRGNLFLLIQLMRSGWCQSAIRCPLLFKWSCILYANKDLAQLFWYDPQTKMKIIRGNLFPLIQLRRAGWCQSAIGCIFFKSIGKISKTSLLSDNPSTSIDLESKLNPL